MLGLLSGKLKYLYKIMQCFFTCSNKCHEPIYLADQKVVKIGRSIATKITDKKVSRNQVELTADYTSKTVNITQVGSNPSYIDNSIILSKSSQHVLRDGSKVCLLRDKYEHYICFKNFSTDNHDVKSNLKRARDSPEKESSVKKQKTEMESIKAYILEDSEEANKVESKDNHLKQATTTKEWRDIEDGKLLLYKSKGLVPSSKIAGMDLDGNLIKTKSGKVHPTGSDDWKIYHPSILSKLKSLQDDGYKIVIFTNQGSIGRGRIKPQDFKSKIEKIEEALKIPFQLFAATNHGIYRKPMSGMWKYLADNENCDTNIDKTQSFYVGDAAGRPVNWKPKTKKDFACSDRTFAKNIGITFYTPEEFFLKEKPAKFEWPEFNPKDILCNTILHQPQTSKLIGDTQEIIVLVGYPASGKTTFVKKHLIPHGYYHVNRDSCGSWQKCVAMCKTQLTQKKSVVIDNTSPDKESRQRYISIAKKANIPIRCYRFNISYEHALHNNRIREMTTTDPKYKSVGKMVFNSYKSNYQEPIIDEGFTEILHINFLPDFENSQIKELYFQYSG